MTFTAQFDLHTHMHTHSQSGRAGWYPDSPTPSPTRQWHYREEDAVKHKLAGPEVNPNILRRSVKNRWEIAEEPLHFDVCSKKCGIGPGLAFAQELFRLLVCDLVCSTVICDSWTFSYVDVCHVSSSIVPDFLFLRFHMSMLSCIVINCASLFHWTI